MHDVLPHPCPLVGLFFFVMTPTFYSSVVSRMSFGSVSRFELLPHKLPFFLLVCVLGLGTFSLLPIHFCSSSQMFVCDAVFFALSLCFSLTYSYIVLHSWALFCNLSNPRVIKGAVPCSREYCRRWS